MVARRSKLLAAGAVLAAGVALAWPLRRDESLPSGRRGVAATSAPAEIAATAAEAATHAAAMPAVDNALEGPTPLLARLDRDPFANLTPATTGADASQPPVFSTISSGAADLLPPATPEPPEQRIHVIHEGDSLHRLAKRYLGDEARALEIFDLNREVLSNPHVLPLGTELKIPVSIEASADK